MSHEQSAAVGHQMGPVQTSQWVGSLPTRRRCSGSAAGPSGRRQGRGRAGCCSRRRPAARQSLAGSARRQGRRGLGLPAAAATRRPHDRPQLCLTPKRSWAIAPGSATWRVPSSPTVPPGAPVAGCASRIGDAVPIGWLNNSGAMRLPGASVKCCWRLGRARRFQAPALHRLAASRSATLPSG